MSWLNATGCTISFQHIFLACKIKIEDNSTNKLIKRCTEMFKCVFYNDNYENVTILALACVHV